MRTKELQARLLLLFDIGTGCGDLAEQILRLHEQEQKTQTKNACQADFVKALIASPRSLMSKLPLYSNTMSGLSEGF